MHREQTTIRLPIQLKEKLQKLADCKGLTLKDYITFILHSYFVCIAQE